MLTWARPYAWSAALLALGLRVIFAYALHNTALFGYTRRLVGAGHGVDRDAPCLLCARVPRQMEEQISDLIGRALMALLFCAYFHYCATLCRWGLMRNTFEENIQEHNHMVAVLAPRTGCDPAPALSR